MTKKNKQQIKFEADITGLKKEIAEGKGSIRSLTQELKLNQEQLKGNKDNIDLLETRVKALQEQYDKQTKVVEQTNEAYEKAVEMLGENSKEASDWKDKLVKAKTEQQKIKNALDETNKELKIQSDRLITTGKKWQETGEHITKLGDKINSVGNKLSVISAGAAGVAVTALKASIDYESAFAGVEKTVDATNEQLAQMKTEILDMSTRMPATASEIAGVAEAAGQLGIQTDNILGFSEAMIGLGESTNLTSDEAATQLARFANIMQMSQKDFDRLGSTIVDLGNNFATTEADIVDMAMRLAGAGKQVGLTEGQVLGLSAALSSVGIEAEMGGSAISKAMVKMQNAVEMGGDRLNDILNQTGMSLRDLQLLSANNSKDFKKLADNIGMTSTELNQFITAGANLEDFARVSGMTAEEFKKAWKEDAAGALSAFIQGLGNAEDKGESAITMLTEMGLTEVRLRDSLLRAANAGDLFNTAITTGTKAWKENTALTKEVDKRYKTTESQMKMLKNEATKLAVEFGNELAPSLRQILKDAKPLLKTISDAIKSFSQLDDKTKQNIIRMGALVVALGPTTKAVGGLTSALGSGIKGIGNFSEAIGNMRTGTTSTNKEVSTLASVVGGLSSPLGIATIGVTALAGAWAVGKMHEQEITEETRKLRKEIDLEADSRKELIDTLTNQQNATLSEMKNLSDLVDELDTLVDENGKVKEGYKDRANFILNELNHAMGTEYELIGDTVQGYQDLKKSVEDVIRAKQIEAVLNAEQSKYDNAWSKKSEAYEKLAKAQKDIVNTEKEIAEWEKKNGQVDNSFWGKLKRGFTTNTNELTKLENLKTKLNEQRETLKRADEEYNNYLNDVATGERNLTILLGEDIDAQNKLIEEKTMAHQNASDNIAETTKMTIENYLYDLQMYKKYKDEALKKQDEASAEYYQKQIESNNRNLEEHARSLAGLISKTKEMTPEEVSAWKELATQSSDIYANVLSELPPTTVRKIQEATGKVVSDETLETAFKNLGRESIDSFSQNDFEGMGKSAIERLANGTWSGRGFLQSTARRLSEQLKLTPSVSSANSGNADGLAYVPFNNYVARLHEGERVLTKKENQDYSRNINNNSQNVVVNIYPQTMTEQEMIKVSNFIEREWGRRS